MKSIYTILILLFLASCNQSKIKKEEVPEKVQDSNYGIITEEFKGNELTNFTLEEVARYAIASIMEQPANLIKVLKSDDLYLISYKRKSDNKKFDYKIKFEGTNVIWANADGRWRNSSYDEKISFKEQKGTLKIITTYSDSSQDIQEFKKGN